MKNLKKKKDEVTIRSSAAEYLTYVASVGDQQDSIEMRYEDENIWLTQKMMATLYDVGLPTINEHIKKIYADSELEESATIRNFRIVQSEGSRQVTRNTKHYNLQMIIAVVNVTDIVSDTFTPSSIDLSTCKIWLEITDTDGLIYAAGATEVLSITSVAITGIETPAANTTLDTEASCATTGVSSTTPQITWTPSDSIAGYNTSYTASITLTADTGYEYADTVTATVLGNSATSVTKNADGTLTVTYNFSATAKDKLVSITTPQAITVANGTAYDAMNLPATVNIVTEGNTVTSAQVTWNTTTPANGSYDPAVLTQQTVTLNGTVACPDSIDANGVSLTTTITITIFIFMN